MSNETIARWFDRAILFFQLLLVVGIPLFFNSFTRSVFEVNKLLLLRYSTISIMGLWGLKTLLLWDQTYSPDELGGQNKGKKKNKKERSEAALVANTEQAQPTSVAPKPLWWFRPSGIEWILVAWCITNLLSTIFSTNFHTAVIGAYDRWEGIYTIINYLCVTLIFVYNVTKQRQFFTVLIGVIVAGTLTALYGLAQSMGYDFMNWSSDPSQRIFASINNPVHYCAFVGMLVPVCSGLLLYSAKRSGTQWFKVLIEMVAVTAIFALYYFLLFHYDWDAAIISRVQYLWFGMIPVAVSIGILGRRLGWQGTIFGAATVLYYAQVLSYSRATWLGFFAAMIFFFVVATQNFPSTQYPKRVIADIFGTIFGTALFFGLYLFRVYNISWIIGGPLALMFCAYIGFLFFVLRSWKDVLLRLLIIFAFAQLQNVSLGFGQMGLYLLAGVGIFSIIWKRIAQRHVLAWLGILYVMYMVVSVYLVLPGLLHQLLGTKAGPEMVAAENMQSKIASIHSVAVEGSARSSMWKTSIVWWKDYPLFGTGPDTVKYMYPKYRREDYGLLEGGHNFTPDKVHNEYFNMLITRGGCGFIIYYFGLVGFFIWSTIKGVMRNKDNPFIFIFAGLLGGAFVYLGQVFFNFGVVATLSLFYVLTALAIALEYRHEALVQGQDPVVRYKPYFKLDAIPSGRLYAIPMLAFLTLFFLVRSTFPFLAERHYREGFNAHSMAQEGGRTDRFKVAEDEMLQATRYAPWETHYLVKLGKIYEDWYYRSQDDQEKRYLLDKAMSVYKKCVKYEPANPWYENRLATMYTLLNAYAGSDDEKRKNLEKAEVLIVQAAADDHNNPLFQVNAGYFKQRVGKFDEALGYYQRAIAIDESLLDAWFNIGDVYVREKQFDKASEVYQTLVRKDPNYNNLHLNIGRMYQEKGDIEKALEEYAIEIQKHPENMQAYINRSYVFIDRRDWRSAAVELQAALTRDPGQVEIRYNLAVAHMNLGDFGQARAELEQVLRMNPGYGKAQQTMAILNRVHVAPR